VQLLSFFLT